MLLANQLTAGQNVVIRDEEWLIKSIDSDNVGEGKLLICEGVSTLVQGTEGKFHTSIDDDIELLDPGKTRLKADTSSQFLDSRLFIESQLRRTVVNDDKIRVGHKAAMRREDFQLLPAQEALKQPRQRILIADGVGLGKTLEAGILVSELMARGRGRRILVIAIKSMLVQFQKEFWARFAIPLTRLDSQAILRIQADNFANHNPFLQYEKSIISIDALKGNERYRRYLETAYWDIIIIDEAHNVAKRGSGQSQRSKLAELIADRSDTLIMLSATPHDGRANSFASLMNMLDPTAIADPDSYHQADYSSKRLVVRRFKKNLRKVTGQRMQEASYFNVKCEASEEEELVFAKIASLRNVNDTLQKLGIEKGFLSSPAACAESVRNRLGVIGRGDVRLTEPRKQEQSILLDIQALLSDFADRDFSKYQLLLHELKDAKSPLYWKPTNRNRLVVFTERIATKDYLKKRLRKDLGLNDDEVATASGEYSDTELQQVVDDFGNAAKPLKLLVCSDVASEGINLHFLSHRLIHFDLPWSLMTYTQRNGRIDRYGQEEKPIIAQLVTHTVNKKIAGDIRILELLQEKSKNAEENIGDPALLMGKHDAKAEEEAVEQIVLSGSDEDELDALTQGDKTEGESLLEIFLSKDPIEPVETGVVDARTLFSSDFDYCLKAIGYIQQESGEFQIETSDEEETFRLKAPEELQYRYRRLPREVQPTEDNPTLTFTADLQRMATAIEEGMTGEDTWPSAQFLWRLSPLTEWLNDRMRAIFLRNEAPLIVLPQAKMSSDHHIFIVAGSFPNKRSQPILFQLAAVEFKDGRFTEVKNPDNVAQWQELRSAQLPNTGIADTFADNIQPFVEAAIPAANRYFDELSKQKKSELDDELSKQLLELAAYQERQQAAIEKRYRASNQPEPIRVGKRKEELADLDETFNKYVSWVEDSMSFSDRPALRLLAVLSGGCS